ncbi:hypothetical protein M1146_03630 [Patescibacteria group bacterium]|nr:hypothetical protein [Patescibacteria group bacterium]
MGIFLLLFMGNIMSQSNKKINLYLGCAEPPFHSQHLEVMKDFNDWIWVDLYVHHPQIKNWDAEKLDEVAPESCDAIYASHLLEHISHTRIGDILSLWRGKLKDNGELILNVPDLAWVARQIIRWENMQPLESPVFQTFEGERGIQAIIYGSHAHPGEYHKSGFTESSIQELLKNVGFYDISVRRYVDAHDMGVLLVKAKKL